MKLGFFEDRSVENLSPLTLTRPAFALRCGPSLLYEKALHAFPEADAYFFARELVADVFAARVGGRGRVKGVNVLSGLRGDDVLLVNGRWIFDDSLLSVGEEVVAVSDGSVVYAYLKRSSAEKAVESSSSVDEVLNWAGRELGEEKIEGAKLIKYPWDLVNLNPEETKKALNYFKRLDGVPPKEFRGLEIVGDEEDVFIAKGARIYPNVVFDTSSGPVIVDEGAVVYPFSAVFGPSYIGRESWIVGGKIREGTTIGPVCRIGGEVEESIVHGYSNKYHAGFLGHSYVGEWVNIGALTTVSDLKNDYSHVEVYVNGKLVDTGSIKVGSFIGDHTKTGIGTLLTTGTSIGVMCNLLSSGEPLPKYIPSFVWYFRGRMSKGLGLKPMLETAKVAMSRRKVQMTEAEEKLFRRLYEETKEERERLIRIHRARRR